MHMKMSCSKIFAMLVTALIIGSSVSCTQEYNSSNVKKNHSTTTGSSIQFQPGKYGPGMYGLNNNFTPWEELEKKGYVKVEDNKLTTELSDEDGNIYTIDNIRGAIVLPDTITEIGNEVFADCPIISITMPDCVEKIGDGTFFGCQNLSKVVIPQKVVYIGERAFANSGIEELDIPNAVETIGAEAFYDCSKLRIIKFSSNLKHIGKYAFSYCNGIEEIYFPDSVEKIDEGILTNCESLERIHLPENIKSIKSDFFANCKSLKMLEIPRNVTKVDMSAFSGTGLEKIVLPENVKVIENGAGQSKIFLEDKEGDDYPNKNLRVIEIRSEKIEKIEKNSFSGLPSDVVIKTPLKQTKKYTRMLRESGLSKQVKIESLQK